MGLFLPSILFLSAVPTVGASPAMMLEATRLAQIGPATRQVLVAAISADLAACCSYIYEQLLPQCLRYPHTLT